jgi:hypothetical protein
MKIRRSPARPLALALCALALAACKTAPSDSSEAMRKRVQLSGNLLDVADVAQTRFQDQVIRAIINGAPRSELAAKEMIRNNAVGNIRALALGQDPYGALLDVYVWCRLGEVACRNRQRARPDLHLECDHTYGEIRQRLEDIVAHGKLITPEERAKFDKVIDDYLAAHPDIANVGLFRISDLADFSGTRMTVLEAAPPDMLSPVADAASELQQARLTAMQLVWLASRLPNAAGWEAQTVVDLTLSSPELARLTASTESLGASLTAHNAAISGLEGGLKSLATSVDSLDKEVSTLGAVRSMVRDALLVIGAILAIALALGAGFLHHLARRLERRIGRE